MPSPTLSEDRARWISILAKATPAEVSALCAHLSPLPGFERLRAPQTGTLLLEGRMGGDGAPFNLGEACLTRCSVRLDTHHVGHAWVLGRNVQHAEQAALIDALMHDDATRVRLAPHITALDEARTRRRAQRAQKVAQTKVDFFTVVRGED